MRMMLSTTDWPTPWRFSPIALSGLSLITIVGNGTRPASSVRRRMPPLVVSSVPPITLPVASAATMPATRSAPLSSTMSGRASTTAATLASCSARVSSRRPNTVMPRLRR